MTALWITPVVKNIDGFVTGAGFPDWGYHGYWADDFHQLDPALRHRGGAQAPWWTTPTAAASACCWTWSTTTPATTRTTSRSPRRKDWLRTEERGTCGQDDVTACVSGLPDFKTELPEVAKYLLDAQLDWAKRSGVDGFRLDTVKHVDHPFWKEHRRRTARRAGPGLLPAGRGVGRGRGVAGSVVRRRRDGRRLRLRLPGQRARAGVQGRGRTVAFDQYLKSRGKVRPGHLLAHFLSSHDVPGALHQLEGDVELLPPGGACCSSPRAGIPTIYYGEEVGRPGGDWPANRSDMPWGARGVKPGAGKPRDEALRELYKKLIAIRRAHPALSRGHARGALHGRRPATSSCGATAGSGDAVVVAVNRGESSRRRCRCPGPRRGAARRRKTCWNGGRPLARPRRWSVTVAPLGAPASWRKSPPDS